MPKSKIAYQCSECGGQSTKWQGQCPHCFGWNTLVEELIEKVSQIVKLEKNVKD